MASNARLKKGIPADVAGILSKLKAIARYLGAPVASIGGAGTFDGVFLTGILAVLLSPVSGHRRPDPAGKVMKQSIVTEFD